MTRAFSPADLALALRALPPFHDGRWRHAASQVDPAIGLIPYARAALDIIRCRRRGWLEPGPNAFARITREGRAVLSAATLECNHRALVDRTPTPERRGFGLGAALGCALILVACVFVMVTTHSPALFVVMALVMCGCVMLLTDYAVGDQAGEVD